MGIWGEIYIYTYIYMCVCIYIYSSSGGKASSCNAGDWVRSLDWEDSSGEGHGSPLQFSCLEHPLGQRSLAGYSPWGRKESDTIGRLNTCVYEGMCLCSCSDICLCINNLCRYRCVYGYIGILCLPAYRYLSMCTMGCMGLHEGVCKCINGIHVCVYMQTYA